MHNTFPQKGQKRTQMVTLTVLLLNPKLQLCGVRSSVMSYWLLGEQRLLTRVYIRISRVSFQTCLYPTLSLPPKLQRRDQRPQLLQERPYSSDKTQIQGHSLTASWRLTHYQEECIRGQPDRCKF